MRAWEAALEIRDRNRYVLGREPPRPGDIVVYFGQRDGAGCCTRFRAKVIRVHGTACDLTFEVAGGFGPPRRVTRIGVVFDREAKESCWCWDE